MGYYSSVALKTTTEGYLVFKQYNEDIEVIDERPLFNLHIAKTSTGFYKLYNDDIKWYTSFPCVQNFNNVLAILDEQEIPYSFIRLGEEVNDIEHRINYTEDLPDEILDFEPVIDMNDPSSDYEEILD